MLNLSFDTDKFFCCAEVEVGQIPKNFGTVLIVMDVKINLVAEEMIGPAGWSKIQSHRNL